MDAVSGTFAAVSGTFAAASASESMATARAVTVRTVACVDAARDVRLLIFIKKASGIYIPFKPTHTTNVLPSSCGPLPMRVGVSPSRVSADTHVPLLISEMRATPQPVPRPRFPAPFKIKIRNQNYCTLPLTPAGPIAAESSARSNVPPPPRWPPPHTRTHARARATIAAHANPHRRLDDATVRHPRRQTFTHLLACFAQTPHAAISSSSWRCWWRASPVPRTGPRQTWRRWTG
jgi:hypothetical protein